MKNRGITLIEVVIYISLILITFFLSSRSYLRFLEKEKLKKEVIEITSVFRKYQKRSEILEEYIPIYFDLENREILFGKSRINLSKDFKYLSKNKSESDNFERYFTKKGNLNKGFTLIILDKSGKLLAEISFDNSNSLSYPVINVKGVSI
ncbi:pilus assembly FimT family protein [Streptobacillus canis]|uniref:pilus assembly FimT family protein n=1 Tax=Streptobacillus canis TaxID=2678686 RepID=UPI0012E25B1F|nr:hypothetical protein [Streptobacillus canis]